MKALLLAAGFGTRLRPLTEHCPKCLVKINGEPLLGIWLRHLVNLGIREIFINTHYLAEQVDAFVTGLSLDVEIKLSFEPELLGTAGTLLSLQGQLGDEELFVAHADNYLLGSLEMFFKHFKAQHDNIKMSMVTFTTEHPERCGIVELDDKGVVQVFHEKAKHAPGNLANGAIYAFKPGFLHWLTGFDNKPQDLSLDVIPNLMGQISTWNMDEGLIDIGTPEALEKAQVLARQAKQCRAIENGGHS